MRALLVPVVAAAVLTGGAGLRTASACPGCRNPNMPINRLSSVELAPGQVRAGIALAGTALKVVHEAGCIDLSDCQEVPVQPRYLHDQHIYPAELRATAEVGLTRLLGVELQLPFRTIHTTIRYATPAGEPYEPLDKDVHHREETLVGIADPWLLLRAGALLQGWLLHFRAGTTIPLGRTEPNPFALGDMGLRHQHVQFGTGTFDPIAAADVARNLGPLSLSGFLHGQLSVYDNRHGFRSPSRLLGGLQGGTRLGELLFGALGLDVLHEGPERWDGRVRQDGNLGRTEILAGISGTYLRRETTVTLAFRMPIYRHIILGDEPAGRLSSPLMVSVMVSRVFGGGF